MIVLGAAYDSMENFSEEDLAKFMTFMLQQGGDSSETTSEHPEPELKATNYRTHGDEDEDLEFSEKNDFLIEERLHCLTTQSKFYEAISLSEEIESVDETDIGIKLLLAECYIQLGRENKAEKTIRDVEKILMNSPACNVDDVMSLALDFSNNSNYIRALLLLRIASDMFYNSPSLSPDDKVSKIFRCLSKMDDVIDAMVKPPEEASPGLQNFIAIQRALGMDSEVDIEASKISGIKNSSSGISERTRVLSLDYGVEVMEEMLETIKSIENADPEGKTLKLARATIMINSQYKEPSQFPKAVKVLKFGIEQVEKQFGKDAEQYSVYCSMLANIGVDYHNAERYKEAESFKLRSVEAAEYALDFDSEEKKRANMKSARDSLRITQSHIKFA